ncbi:hypothetical protein DL96DRAFT_1609155 [Flagelloscypha sp. PMI_526]|nr:hypothetical protein DL96DRAFT_1609155 [Flagelloscypha sp. PMI_526]
MAPSTPPPKPQAPPTVKRLRVIIVALPLAVASGYTLWNRLVNGVPQRELRSPEGVPGLNRPFDAFGTNKPPNKTSLE